MVSRIEERQTGKDAPESPESPESPETSESPESLGSPASPQTSQSDLPVSTSEVKQPTNRIMSAATIAYGIENDDLDAATLGAMLDEYLEAVQFKDPSMTAEYVDGAIRYATGEGKDRDDRLISPIPSNIAERMTALLKLKKSGQRINVAAVNVGGTNTTTTIADVQNGRITLKDLDQKSFRRPEETGPIKCVDHIDYWERTVPATFIEKLRLIASSEGATPAIEIAVAAPTRDGRIEYMSDKAVFERNPLAPANEAESRAEGEDRSKYPTIAESFSQFLASKGINIAPKLIYEGENDTVGIVLGRPIEATSLLNEERTAHIRRIGGVVIGTGFNACAFNRNGEGFNYEIGHLGFETPCKLDQEVSDASGIGLDVESCVSGKILGDVLKAAIMELTQDGSNLRNFAQSLDTEKVNMLISKLGLDDEQLESIPELQFKGTPNEELLLKQLCTRFRERAAEYLAAILDGISRSMPEIAFIKEGSVVDKNPKFVNMVNRIAGRQILIGLGSIDAENKSSSDVDVNKLPSSFYGAINDAAAKAFLARQA